MRRHLSKSVIVGVALSTILAGTASASGGSDRQNNREAPNYRNGADINVTTTADTVDADPSDGKCKDAAGECSLRAAIMTANASSDKVQIDLRKGTYSLGIAGSDADGAEAGDLDVVGHVEINGRTAIIDLAGFADRAFDIGPDSKVKIQQLTVRDGQPSDGASGGAFRNAGELELNRVTATGNVVNGAGASGGAILNTGTLTVERSNLSGNSATRAGGAIEASAGRTVVIKTTLADNTTGDAPGNGGALHLTGEGYVEVTRSTVSGNVAAAEGGGLWNSATGTMLVSRTTLVGNVANGTDADQGGGALFNDGGSMTVSASSITTNAAPAGSGSGGGILNNLGTLDVSRTRIAANTAQRAGGGIETVDGSVAIDRSILSRNETGPAPGNGGGLHASGANAMVTINRSTVSHNVAALEGGGLWAGAGDSVMTVTRSIINANTANGTEAINGGGGLFNKGGLLVVEGSAVKNNAAPMGSASGGGILNLGTLVVERTRIDGNTSARAGGGIESNDVNNAGDATLTRVQIRNNTTGSAPGNGGGLHVTGSSITTIIDRSVVTGNDAVNEGGGLWNFADATMTVTRTVIDGNTSPIGANVFQNGDGGNFTVDGKLVPAGENGLAFP